MALEGGGGGDTLEPKAVEAGASNCREMNLGSPELPRMSSLLLGVSTQGLEKHLGVAEVFPASDGA